MHYFSKCGAKVLFFLTRQNIFITFASENEADSEKIQEFFGAWHGLCRRINNGGELSSWLDQLQRRTRNRNHSNNCGRNNTLLYIEESKQILNS